MDFAAHALVGAMASPAALVDISGRVLTTNAQWSALDGPRSVHSPVGRLFPPEDPSCDAHAQLSQAITSHGERDEPIQVACSCDTETLRTVRVASIATVHGRLRRLVTTEVARTDQVSRAKSEFLALLSHEVRTPVTAVVGMVEVLRAMTLPQEIREVVDGVHRSTHALQSITSDLIDLARLETGQLELDIRPVGLRSLLEGVIEPLQDQARQKALLLLAAVEPGMPEAVWSDANRIRQVLTNLVGNAVKFTDRGEVIVTARQDGDGSLVFAVRDTGPGLMEEDQRRIFEPFVQLDPSASRRHEGSGIGLTIAARIVERMGGTIETDSLAGQGSEFRVRLPLRSAPADEEPGYAPLAGRRVTVVAPSPHSAQALTWLLTSVGAVATTADMAQVLAGPSDAEVVLWCDDTHDPEVGQRMKSIEKAAGRDTRVVMISTTDPRRGLFRGGNILTAPLLRHRLVATLNQERTGIRGAPVVPSPLPGGRVLLAEDNDVNRGVLTRMITLLGVECDAVADGSAAVHAVLTGPRYDAVLMDVQMPIVDGMEATRRIREAGFRTPILALTATAMRKVTDRCRENGMDGVLNKPITLSLLRQGLEPYLTGQTGPAPGDAVHAGQATSPPQTAAAETTVAKTLVDADLLRDLAGQLCDRPLMIATVRAYLDQVHPRRTELAEAVRAGDHTSVSLVAHTWRSSSAQLGAVALAAACARLEERAVAGAPDDELRGLFEQLECTVDGTATALSGYLADEERVG